LSAPLIAIGVAASIIAFAIVVGLIGGRLRQSNPTEFLVAGRSLGALLLWLLLAGEIYTTFTFLGAAGWAYGKGAPVYYILCYGPVAYVIGYFVMPLAWKVGHRFGMLTIGDFFATRYASTALGAIVAIVGFVFLIPYITLQLSGLQTLLGIAGYGAIDAQLAVIIAVLVIALFVFATGLRGAAWTAIVKDAVVLAGVIFAGVVLPFHFFGSPAGVIAKVEAIKPQWLTLSTTDQTYNLTWFVSTVILNGITFFLFPQSLMSVYSAKSADSLRRNYVWLPLYNVMLALMVFAGLTALIVVPGLTGTSVDQSFVSVVAKYYPPWVLGAIAGAGSLAALVPVSVQLLGASGLFVKNVVEDAFRWQGTERQRTLVVRALVLALAAAALVLWVFLKTTLVELLLIAYNGMAQFVPGFAAAFWWRRATAIGVAAGISAGIAICIYGVVAKVQTTFGVNIGLVALVVNAIVMYVFSVVTKAPQDKVVDDFRAAAFADDATPN
jgi:solute:Na+ symporter, SSS family